MISGMSTDHAPGGVALVRRSVGRTCRGLFSGTLGRCGTGRGHGSERVGDCCSGVSEDGRRGLFCRIVIRVNGGSSAKMKDCSTRITA